MGRPIKKEILFTCPQHHQLLLLFHSPRQQQTFLRVLIIELLFICMCQVYRFPVTEFPVTNMFDLLEHRDKKKAQDNSTFSSLALATSLAY